MSKILIRTFEKLKTNDGTDGQQLSEVVDELSARAQKLENDFQRYAKKLLAFLAYSCELATAVCFFYGHGCSYILAELFSNICQIILYKK